MVEKVAKDVLVKGYEHHGFSGGSPLWNRADCR